MGYQNNYLTTPCWNRAIQCQFELSRVTWPPLYDAAPTCWTILTGPGFGLTFSNTIKGWKLNQRTLSSSTFLADCSADRNNQKHMTWQLNCREGFSSVEQPIMQLLRRIAYWWLVTGASVDSAFASHVPIMHCGLSGVLFNLRRSGWMSAMIEFAWIWTWV